MIYEDEKGIKKTIYAMLKKISGYKKNDQIIVANQGSVHGDSEFITYSFQIKDSTLTALRSQEIEQSKYNSFLIDVVVNCYNNKLLANTIRSACQFLDITSFNILHLGEGKPVIDLSYIEQGVYSNRHQTSMPIHIYIKQSSFETGKTLKLGNYTTNNGGR